MSLGNKLDPQTYHCPCCGNTYTAELVGGYDYTKPRKTGDGYLIPLVVEHATTAEGKTLDVCGTCGLPCCPACESIAGEGLIVCTRCTTFPECTHAPSA